MTAFHVFGRRTVAAQWTAYASLGSLDDAIVSARGLTSAERVNEAIIVKVVRDFTARGCSQSFGAEDRDDETPALLAALKRVVAAHEAVDAEGQRDLAGAINAAMFTIAQVEGRGR